MNTNENYSVNFLENLKKNKDIFLNNNNFHAENTLQRKKTKKKLTFCEKLERNIELEPDIKPRLKKPKGILKKIISTEINLGYYVQNNDVYDNDSIDEFIKPVL